MKKFGFVMRDVACRLRTRGETQVPVYHSGESHVHSIGPGISEIMLPDGTIVNVDPQGNILKDIVD